MKKKKLGKKLTLNKSIIANLDSIKGGLPLWTYGGDCAEFTDPYDGCSVGGLCDTANGDACDPEFPPTYGGGTCWHS